MAKKDNEVQEGAEDTKAGKSIEAHPPVPNRSQMMAAVLNDMTLRDDENLTKWYDQMIAVSKNKGSAIPDGAAGHNAGTLSTHPSHADASMVNRALPVVQAVREDLQNILKAGEVSEDVADKTVLLFEAAVNARVALEAAKIEEEHEERLAEETEKLIDQLDSYLDYAAKEFFEENEIAIDSSIKLEMYEEFFEGLRGLFEAHNIDVPDSKVDVVEALTSRVSELEQELDERTAELIDARDTELADKAKRAFDESAKGLTDADVEKLKVLSESVEYDGDDEDLKKKLAVIREANFGKRAGTKPRLEIGKRDLTEAEFTTVKLVEASDNGEPIEGDPEVHPEARAIYEAISRVASKRI